jgi:formiminoglutamase
MQHNRFNDGSQLALLGHLGFADEIARAHITPQTNPEDLHEIICLIDHVLANVVQQIVALGKIPIAIGGGHNNAYGLLKGCANALGKPVNALNIDAHTDLRPTNYRHSGNGFLYAFNEGYLGNYVVFGLHENYSLETNLKFIDAHADRIRFTSYEEMCLRKTKKLADEAQKALAFVGDGPFGLEVDCDTIENIPSSALTPSGFTTGQARQLVHAFSRSQNATYLHICEAAPDTANANQMMVVGKLISTLVADFIRK